MLAIGAAIAVALAVFAWIKLTEDSAALKWLKSTYGSSGPDIEFGCSVSPDAAAGLDWRPGLGFSLEELADAWRDICG